MPFCTNCGHDNPEGANFCSACGTPLRAPDRGERAVEQTGTLNLTGTIPGGLGGPGGLTGSGGVLDDRHDELDDLTDAERAAIDALPAGNALLVVRRGPNSGSRFLLDSELTTAGRHPDSGIFLDDVTVSRRHAEFRRDGRGFRVHDVGSLNGTYVNRDRIDDAVLANGDEVQVGKFRLVFHASPADLRDGR